ncbi:SDR family NAD(P)-dependent oxidoreductase [Candidatus Neomarinimicrobiota bacterium]
MNTSKQILGNNEFKQKIAVVTGGAGVLGSTMVKALNDCEVNVAVLDKDYKQAEIVVKNIKSKSQIIAVEADILDEESLQLAHQKIQHEFGSIDFLINAAGGNHPNASTGPERTFAQLPKDSMKFVINLNLLGTILCCQEFCQDMQVSGAGSVVNISSMNAIRPLTRIPAYSAAKAGVSNFTQWLATHMAVEYSPAIRVNAIAPGFFLTKQNKYLLMDDSTGEMSLRGQRIIDHTPAGRFGNAEDLVGPLLWLLSAQSKFVTGIVLPVDGGFSAFSGV